MAELSCGSEIHRGWRPGQASSNSRELDRHCSCLQIGNHKASVELDLELGSEVKDNEMSF